MNDFSLSPQQREKLMVRVRGRNKILTIPNGALAALALYCVVQHLFTYNYSVGKISYIPLMSGAAIYLSMLLGALLLFRQALKRQSPQVIKEIVMVAGFFLMVLLVILIRDDEARSYRYFTQGTVMSTNLSYLVGHILAFVVGFSLRDVVRFRLIILVGFFLLVANVLINVDMAKMMLNLQVRDEGHRGIYLMLGDTFGIWALLSCAVVGNRWVRWGLVVVSLICLALLNSRTSLYAFIIVVPFMFRFSPTRAILVIAVVVALLFGGALHFSDQYPMVDRMFASVLSGEDSSTATRLKQFQVGIDNLVDNWIVGDYAGQVREFGEIGTYMHNILSYWRQFGLVPFLLLIIMWIRAARRATPCLTTPAAWKDPDLRFFLFSFIFLAIEILISRAYSSPFPWLVLGQSAGLLSAGSPLIQHRPEVVGNKKTRVVYLATLKLP